MSVELLKSLKRQAEALTPQEKSYLGTYLLEQAEQETAQQAAPVDVAADEETAERKRQQHAKKKEREF